MQQGLRNMLASSAICGGGAHNMIIAKHLRRFVIVAAVTTWRRSQRGGAQNDIMATFIIYDCLIPDSTYNVWIGIKTQETARTLEYVRVFSREGYSGGDLSVDGKWPNGSSHCCKSSFPLSVHCCEDQLFPSCELLLPECTPGSQNGKVETICSATPISS